MRYTTHLDDLPPPSRAGSQEHTLLAEASAAQLLSWLSHHFVLTVSNNKNNKVHATYTPSQKPGWPLNLCFMLQY